MYRSGIGMLMLGALALAAHVPGRAEEATLRQGLVAHYPLVQDARDVSGRDLHGTLHDVTFVPGKGASFDGRGGHIEVPDNPALDLGTDDFTISAWITTPEELTDALGDVAGKFDPSTRTGFNFYLQHLQGVASSVANTRNLFFGIDAGTAPSAWEDRGRPGEATMVFALTVFRDHLYAGTFEMGAEGKGRVWRLEGDAWVDCGAPGPANAITSLAVHENRLYAANSHYRSRGSALGDAENETPGGHVYRMEQDGTWKDMGRLGESEAVGGLVTFRSYLWGSSLYAPAGLFRMKWGGGWEDMGNPGGRVVALTVHDGAILGSGYDAEYGGVYRFGADLEWSDLGTPADTTQTYSFMTHYGELYVGTWPTGKVFKHGGGQDWLDVGQLGEEKEVMGMLVYNGMLYGGTLPLAEVYRFDGPGGWTSTGQLDTTPEVTYRRAWTMAVQDGTLFCGTLPSGRVFAMEAGQAVTHDTQLADGWRHVAAVRRGNRLALYVDGEQVSERVFTETLDISNDRPLTIGFGAHDYFHGHMNDFRIYRRALTDTELAALSDYEARGQGVFLDFPMKSALDPAQETLDTSAYWKIADFRGSGSVRVEDGVVYLEEGDDMTGIVWRGPLARMNYEITLEAMRFAGSDFFCGLTFPYGEDPCSLILGGWGGSLVGLSSLNFQDAYNNETARTKFFENNQWYRIRLRVTEGRMEAWIDEEQYVDLQVGDREVGIRWEMQKTVPLGIATWRTGGAIRNVMVRAIGTE